MTNPRRRSNPHLTLTDEYVETLKADEPPSYWSRLAYAGHFPEGVNGDDPRIKEILAQRYPTSADDPEDSGHV